jgi:hypothetical protein
LSKKVLLFFLVSILTIEAVYIASGQPLHTGDTSRYLIMLAPIVVILLSCGVFLRSKARFIISRSIAIALATNIFLLICALAQSWTSTLPADTHLASVVNYLRASHITYGYASMDTALPETFFYPSDTSLLPLGCTHGRLTHNTLFYDQAAYRHIQAQQTSQIALIFDYQIISNVPSICTVATIKSQFGSPDTTTYTSDGSLVMIYNNPQQFASKID